MSKSPSQPERIEEFLVCPAFLPALLNSLAVLVSVLGVGKAVLLVQNASVGGLGVDVAVVWDAAIWVAAGICAAGVLICAAQLLKRRVENMAVQREILSALREIARAPLQTVHLSQQGVLETDTQGSHGASEPELLQSVLTELQEANANLLLSASQRRRKGQRLCEERIGKLTEQFCTALSDLDFARCEAVLAELVRCEAPQEQLSELRQRLEQHRESVRVEELASERQRVSDLMATGAHAEAQAAAKLLVGRYPDSQEAAEVLEHASRECRAHQNELRTRLYATVQRSCDSRRWSDALEAANCLLASCGPCVEAESVKAMLPTLEENSRIVEVRQLGDRFGDMIRRKRYVQAVTLAREIVERFPGTKAAADLKHQMPRLEELAGG